MSPNSSEQSRNRHVKEKVEIRARQAKLTVFGILYPGPESLSLLVIRQFGALISDVGIHIPVQKDSLTSRKYISDSSSCAMPVFSEQQGHELGMNRLNRSEIPPEEPAYEFSVHRSIITGEMDILQIPVSFLKIIFKHPDLSRLACPVKTFQYH